MTAALGEHCLPASEHVLFSTGGVYLCVLGRGGCPPREVGCGWGWSLAISVPALTLGPAASLAPSTPPVTLATDCLL